MTSKDRNTSTRLPVPDSYCQINDSCILILKMKERKEKQSAKQNRERLRNCDEKVGKSKRDQEYSKKALISRKQELISERKCIFGILK